VLPWRWFEAGSAVVAVQYVISDTAALAFARGFYSAIGHGRGVDEAASSSRTRDPWPEQSDAGMGYSGADLRGHDTRVFTVAPSGAARPPQLV